MIRLLLVEDSVTQREILRNLIEADGKLSVVAEARNGREAVQFAARFRPDVVLMDIHMPDMDGVTATREIMHTCPVPIVIASAALRQRDVDLGLEALKAGAVSVVEKPQGAVLLHLSKIAPELCAELVGASKAKVNGQRRLGTQVTAPRFRPLPSGQVDLIGICASTGGPPVLVKILSELPKPFPLPVLIVQHIAASFVPGFAKWLANLSGQNVGLAQQHQELTPGFWLSPGGAHLCIDTQRRIFLQPPAINDIHCPSGNELFRSLAEYEGSRSLGVQLTGMGDDGARGLLALRDAGGRTISQDEESSLIYGMPRAAAENGGSQMQLPPAGIIEAIRLMIGVRIAK